MVVLITGASSGIGSELATQLAMRGARLVLSARRADRLEALNRALGGSHLVVPADVAQTQQCFDLVERAYAHYGRIDTLVCNAGYGAVATVADMPPEAMRAIFATNVFGTTDLIAAASGRMRTQAFRERWRGQVMIVSSAAGRRGLPYFGAYSATKAAQLSLAEALRIELRPERVAVTSVHPIGTSTDFFDTAEKDSSTKIQTTSRMKLRQPVQVVAGKMIGAMERPRPELWPFPLARWALSVATICPRGADWVMERMRREIAAQDRPGRYQKP